MALIKRATPEEKEAQQKAKLIADAERERLKEEQRLQQMRVAFLTSPPGQARTAFERGDRVFQCSFDVKQTKAVVIPMWGATNTTSSTDPTEILNAVCREGWELVTGSFVFVELGSESRDKFLASGQNVAVQGTVIGYYLFNRSEANKQATRDPWNTHS